MIRASVLTVSDRSFRDERPDLSGPAVVGALASLPVEVLETEVVADDRLEIASAIRRLASVSDLVLTTGGTGLSPRDVTPEATLDVLEREIPGFGEEMRRRSMEITPTAIVSRATAGTVGRTLVVNLPGSPKAAVECLAFVTPALLHVLSLLDGEAADCA